MHGGRTADCSTDENNREVLRTDVMQDQWPKNAALTRMATSLVETIVFACVIHLVCHATDVLPYRTDCKAKIQPVIGTKNSTSTHSMISKP